MSKNVKKVKLPVLLALSAAGGVMLMAGCSGPKVLSSRDYIPAPVLQPPQVSSQTEGSESNGFSFEQHALPVETPLKISESSKNSGKIMTSPTEQIKYTVQKGDSYWKIAKNYGVGVKELAAYNKMDVNKPLLAGTVIEIPPGGRYESTAENLSSSPVKFSNKHTVNAGGYTVAKGDSIWTVANKLKVTRKELADANGLSADSTLKVGQVLVIPKGGSQVVSKAAPKIIQKAGSVASVNEKTQQTAQKQEPVQTAPASAGQVKISAEDSQLLNQIVSPTNNTAKSPSSQETSAPPATQATPAAPSEQTENLLPHTVKEGDTWNTISDMYGVSLKDLKAANQKISSEKELKPGQIVNIPEE